MSKTKKSVAKSTKSTKPAKAPIPSWEELQAQFANACQELDGKIDWVRAITVNRRKLGVGYTARPNPALNADPLMLVWVELAPGNPPSITEITLRESVESVRKLHSTEILTCCDSESGDDGFDQWLGDVANEL